MREAPLRLMTFGIWARLRNMRIAQFGSRSVWRPVLAILAAQVLALQTLLLATVGAAQTARAGTSAPNAIICLAHESSVPAPADQPDEHAACLTHCVLCAAVQAALPTQGPAALATAHAELVRWRSAE